MSLRRHPARPAPVSPSRGLPSLLTAGLIATVGLTAPAAAQSYETGGTQLSLGVVLSGSVEDNRALETETAGTSTGTDARLSLGLLSETPSQSLGLNLSGTLRWLNTPEGTTQSNGFIDPGLSLSYERTSASARLGLSAFLSESDLSQDYQDAETLDYVSGTATRRKTGGELSLNWGEDSPLGFGTFARIARTRYVDGTATGLDSAALDDSTRRTLGATARMDLDRARRLDLGVTWSDFAQDAVPGRRKTVSVNTSLTQDLALGSLTAGLTGTRTEDGERYAFTLGRVLDLPLGQLSGRIGVDRGTSGKSYLSGGLDLSRALERGALTLGLSRAVASSDTDDSEVLSTRASFGLTHDLTPLSRLGFGVNLAKAEDTSTGAQTVSGTFSTTYSRELSEDWSLDAGYTHRIRDRDSGGVARSNRIFLEVGRSFVTRL